MPRRRRTEPLVEQQLPGMEDVPPDPAPGQPATRSRRKIGAAPAAPARRTASTRAPSRATMIRDVEEQIYTWLSLFAAGWSLRDPICSAPLFEPVGLPVGDGRVEPVERLAAMTRHLVAIIARSDKLLQTLASTGTIGELAKLGVLVWPVLRTVASHHGPNGVGHEQLQESADDLAARYPAFAG